MRAAAVLIGPHQTDLLHDRPKRWSDHHDLGAGVVDDRGHLVGGQAQAQGGGLDQAGGASAATGRSSPPREPHAAAAMTEGAREGCSAELARKLGLLL